MTNMKSQTVLDVPPCLFFGDYAWSASTDYLDKLSGEIALPAKLTGIRDRMVYQLNWEKHNRFVEEKNFVKTVHIVKPIKSWHPAEPDTVDKFLGMVNKSIPELPSVDEEKLEEYLERSRNSEF